VRIRTLGLSLFLLRHMRAHAGGLFRAHGAGNGTRRNAHFTQHAQHVLGIRREFLAEKFDLYFRISHGYPPCAVCRA
jgi:hypothetical protein